MVFCFCTPLFWWLYSHRLKPDPHQKPMPKTMPGAMPCACDGWCSCAMVVPGRSDPNSLEWIRIRGADRKVEAFPPRERIHIPPWEVGKIMDSKCHFWGDMLNILETIFLTFPTGKKTNEAESPTYTRCIRSLKQVSPCKAANLNWYCWKKSFPQWIQRVSRFSSAIRFKYDHLIYIIYIYNRS